MPVTLIFYWPSFQTLRWRKYQYSSSLRYLLMEAWIHFEQWIGFVILFEFRACWKKNLARCMYISTPIYSGVFPLLIVNHWISLCHSQFYVLYWHFSSPLYQFFVCCLLTVTMTSSTQGTITGYLTQALIWIGNVFVYHTCKTLAWWNDMQICSPSK